MANDLWRTPPSVIEYVTNRWGNIALDLCADISNTVSPEYYSEDDSMLDATESELSWHEGIMWCNPPYSNPLPFVTKCKEIAEMGFTVIMLLNQDTSTKWFGVIDKHAKGIYPVTGARISFVDGDGNKIKGNNKPQILVKFSPHGKQHWETIHISELQ